jgi:hypothetical protein
MRSILSPWQRVWRDGLAPQFSDEELRALQRGLRENSLDLIQAATTEPLACPRTTTGRSVAVARSPMAHGRRPRLGSLW